MSTDVSGAGILNTPDGRKLAEVEELAGFDMINLCWKPDWTCRKIEAIAVG